MKLLTQVSVILFIAASMSVCHAGRSVRKIERIKEIIQTFKTESNNSGYHTNTLCITPYSNHADAFVTGLEQAARNENVVCVVFDTLSEMLDAFSEIKDHDVSRIFVLKNAEKYLCHRENLGERNLANFYEFALCHRENLTERNLANFFDFLLNFENSSREIGLVLLTQRRDLLDPAVVSRCLKLMLL